MQGGEPTVQEDC